MRISRFNSVMPYILIIAFTVIMVAIYIVSLNRFMRCPDTYVKKWVCHEILLSESLCVRGSVQCIKDGYDIKVTVNSSG